jgi:hypothetical protein
LVAFLGSLVLVFQVHQEIGGHHGLLLHGSNCTSICPNFIVYMCESSTLAKACGIKHGMVLLGTSWGNTLGTCKTLWEHDGNNQKRKKKWALLSVC